MSKKAGLAPWAFWCLRLEYTATASALVASVSNLAPISFINI